MLSEEQLFKSGLKAGELAKIYDTEEAQIHQPLEVLDSETDPRKAIKLVMMHVMRQVERKKFSRSAVKVLLDPLHECLKANSKKDARYLLGIMIWAYDTANKGNLRLDKTEIEKDPLEALISAFQKTRP